MGGSGLRVMYDALYPNNIPADAQLVASYDDGQNRPPAGWEQRFPNAKVVEITRIYTDNTGHVLDVENSDATPEQSVAWVRMRRAAGFAHPTVYMSASVWQTCRNAFAAAGEPEPQWWVAYYNDQPVIPPGAVAHQYTDAGPYDLSVVAPYWLGVDGDVQAITSENDMTSDQIAQLNTASNQAANMLPWVEWMAHELCGITAPGYDPANPPAGATTIGYPGGALAAIRDELPWVKYLVRVITGITPPGYVTPAGAPEPGVSLLDRIAALEKNEPAPNTTGEPDHLGLTG